jgi:glycosyltransferase involved in cell wall biosynthesis
MARQRVLIAYKSLPAYRVRFFEDLQASLRGAGIDLDVVYGNPDKAYILRGDTRSLCGGAFVQNRMLEWRGRRLIWQPILRRALRYDLVILEQASSLLVNYPLLLLQRLPRSPRVALWGHGANLQSNSPRGFRERFKRWYSRLPHWWFAYTPGSAGRVRALGFDARRISVVQNAIDTATLRDELAGVSPRDIAELRQNTGSSEGNTGLFIGSLYPEKRLDFLLDVARIVQRRRPGFQLLIAGDGPGRTDVEVAATSHDYVHYLGRLDGSARAVALAAADCILMPGLVGLGVLDAFAAQAPVIATTYPFHSPEFEYLQPNVNGIVVDDWRDATAYSEAVVRFLADPHLQHALRAGCAVAARTYTNEAMVENFEKGVHHALKGEK